MAPAGDISPVLEDLVRRFGNFMRRTAHRHGIDAAELDDVVQEALIRWCARCPLAFSEGCGIYSEDLGAEMGLYTTRLDSIGHLVHLLDVAVAYYLDVGTHVRGWNRTTR